MSEKEGHAGVGGCGEAVMSRWSMGRGMGWRRIRRITTARSALPPAAVDGEDVGEVPREDRGSDNRRFAIIVRVRRGREADYIQDGEFDSDSHYGFSKRLHEGFDKASWAEIKEKGIFMTGAEENPTAQFMSMSY